STEIDGKDLTENAEDNDKNNNNVNNNNHNTIPSALPHASIQTPTSKNKPHIKLPSSYKDLEPMPQPKLEKNVKYLAYPPYAGITNQVGDDDEKKTTFFNVI